MIPDFATTVLDTLLPGDGTLPPASRSGIDAAAFAVAHAPVFAMIAEAARGEAAFVAMTADAKAKLFRIIDSGLDATTFKAMVADALHDYYTSDAVMSALRWRQGPPQPAGHKLAEADDATWQRLEKVKRRPRLWRGTT